MERASDIIRKIWVICSEGGGVEGIISFFLFPVCVRQDKTRCDFFKESEWDLYLHSPTCTLP